MRPRCSCPALRSSYPTLPSSHSTLRRSSALPSSSPALRSDRPTPWLLLALATVLPLSGCAAGHSGTADRAASAARSQASGHLRPVWLRSLHMISSSAGWALRWTGDPGQPAPLGLALARTADGGRTWTNVTPSAARPVLTPGNITSGSEAVLYASSPTRAWLAVTLVTSLSSYGTTTHLTEVFGTTNGGHSWTRSRPVRAPGIAGWLTFTGPADGWLLMNLGAAMQQNPVRLYATTDGGRRWSLIARTRPWPKTGTSASGLPVYCDKSGIAFATPRVGWISGACNGLTDALLVSRDGGRHWAPQPLPVPASTCQRDGCDIAPPQFFGATGFLAISEGNGQRYFLTSHDTGATWRRQALPPGQERFVQIEFFDTRHGVLIPGDPQGQIGRVCYVTGDSGRTWRLIRQSGPAWQPGATLDFVSPATGFAWNPNAQRALIYATTNGGRSWNPFVPLG